MESKELKKEFTETRDYAGKTFKVRLRAADMWSGVQRYDNCRVVFYVSIDAYGQVVTGLNKEDQARIEEALNFEKGFLAPNSKFWKTFSVQIDSDGFSLDTNNPYQELQYLFLKRNKRISKTLKAIHPEAVAVMYCEEEEAKTANVSRKVKTNAYKKFASMSHDEMKKILVMYGKRAVDSMDNEVVEDTLGLEVELNPAKFMEIVSDPLLENKMFINSLYNKGVIKKIGNRYTYGDITLGVDLASAVVFLRDPKNQPVLLALKELGK